MTDSALLDTDVLTAYRDEEHPRHTDVVAFVRGFSATTDLLVAPQSLYEFWVVATRPRASVNGLGFSVAQVDANVALFRQAFTVLPDPPGPLDEWLKLCRTHGVLGKPAHDARLAAYARLCGIKKIVTLNARDLGRHGLNVVVP